MLDGARLDELLHGDTTDPRTYLQRLGYAPPHLAAVGSSPLTAVVNHGVWVALDGCGTREGVHGGGVVWLDRPMVWCPLCRNKVAGWRWRPVVLPAEREAIEAALLARPDVATRNWHPGETVDDLRRENRDHGLE